ncbi:MurR/RpiR family transcriptional regulator [Pandoraea communis]|uniref:RpiR family transcriptional regulator n=1 Tax=Pandoraea communis TaxID=2508297 RepID=A0A5E4VH97_9BURK|nr:MurR/RpiR family transcriptional regulator [Pandoraea communis]MDM8357577.1 MurR/RpiR family transcriptional regulator [Pandoraea communis]VVE11647.1 RpiR family transcriptional regulator [Pandoraea communis]
MQAASRSFVGRIRSQLNELPAAERRLAEFVLDFPGDLASYTGAELAELAEVSKATVSRFVRRLGYPGYEEARRHVRDEKQTGAALLLSDSAKAASPNAVEAHANQGVLNLTGTFGRLSNTEIDKIAKAIVAARQVFVFGFRSSQPFASYFRWQILQVVEHVIVLPGPGETVGEHLASMEAKDFVVVFGLRRRVPQTDAILDYAASAGTKTLYITDQQAPEHQGATWSINCDTAAPGPLDNHVAVLGLCGLLATKVLEHAGTRGRKRLSAIESAHDHMGEL